MLRLALAAATALLLSAPCTPAYAQAAPSRTAPSTDGPPPDAPPLCAPLALHAAYLARRWGERPVAPGRIGAIPVILFVNPARRTWTLIRVVGPATGCAVGAGRLTTPRAPAKPGTPPRPISRPGGSVF